MCRIKLIYWTFVLTYSMSLVYSLTINIFPELLSRQTQFVDNIIDMSILMLVDFVPILIVAIAHFTSYSSVGRLLKIVKTLKMQEMTMDVEDTDSIEGPVMQSGIARYTTVLKNLELLSQNTSTDERVSMVSEETVQVK